MSDYNGDPFAYEPIATRPASVEKTPHYAKIEITTSGLGINPITHRLAGDQYHKIAQVVSHPDGMVIGCTFISNEAIEKLWEYHQRYIKDKQSLKHQ